MSASSVAQKRTCISLYIHRSETLEYKYFISMLLLFIFIYNCIFSVSRNTGTLSTMFRDGSFYDCIGMAFNDALCRLHLRCSNYSFHFINYAIVL